MLKSDAAAFLAGVKQVEGAAASAPTNLHVITGEVGTTSEDGKTTVSIDGLVFSEEDSQEIQIDTLGGLEEGDIATIILTGESGHGMTPLAIGGVGSVDRLKARVVDTELLLADKADIEDLEAATARIGDLEADHVSVDTLEAATARIETLEVDHVSVADFEVEQANIDSLQAATADIDTIRANSAKVQNLTAAQLEADHATIGTLDTTYMHADMANADVAWIQNGTIKDGAIVSAMINDVSANKLTAGTINGSVINVTNLNADNITTGTINGQRIGEGSLSLSKLEENVYTETEVDNIVDGLNDRIDGAIETHTGTAVPTLNNSPASSWNTTKLRDEHVGDVYYVVNSQSQQNGYCYRFTKSGSTYSWQLIKDSDVTAALSRLTTAEGKITTFDSDISQLKTDTGTLTTKTTSLETRMSNAESDILDKVDTTTFNEVSDTVDQHSQTISQHTTAISNKADSSTVTAVTNRVSKNEQDISGINTTIGELQETVESKADGSTVSTISNKLNTVSDTVDGHTQTLTSIQNTLSTKADSSTVSTLQTNYATFKQQTEQFESTVGTTYATKTELKGATDDITELEGRVSTNETSISNNASAIALKANSSDVYTKSGVDGLISTEVTNRNAAITAKANEITSTVSQTYTTKTEFDNLEIGGRNLLYNTGDWSSWACTPKATVSDGVLTTANTDTSAFQRANGWFTLDKADIVDRVITVSFEAKKTDATALSTLCFQLFTTSAAPKSVTSGNIPEGTRYYVNLSASSGPKVTIENATAINATTWTKVTITFKPSEVLNASYTEYAYLAMYVGINNRVGSAQYRRLKAEFANRASDWTPAPEDIETRVSSAESAITQNAQNIELKVSESDVTGNYLIGKINLNSTTASIAAQRINLQGAVTISDLSSDAQSATLNSNIVGGGINLIGAFNLYGNNNSKYDHSTGTLTSTTTTNTADNSVYLQLYKDGIYVRQYGSGFGASSVGKLCGWTFEKMSDFNGIRLKFNGDKADAAVVWSIPSIADGTTITLSFRLDSISSDGKGNGGVISGINLRAGTLLSEWSLAPQDEIVGGRNLFVDTDRYLTTFNGSAFGGENSLLSVIPAGETITISVEINADNLVWASSGQRRIGCETSVTKTGGGSQYIGAWAGTSISQGNNIVEVLDGTMHKRISKTFVLLGDMVVGRDVNLYTQGVASGTLSVGRVKVERGDTATDWTPSPEDVDSAISNAAKTATSYVTDITGGGIMVHPSGDQNTGVRVTSDVDILRGGTSVANYGTTARIGTLAGKHVSIDSDSVDLMDGNTSLATFGANDTHIGMSGTGNVYMANDKFLLSAVTTEGTWDSTEGSVTTSVPYTEVKSGFKAQNIGTNYRVYSGLNSTLGYNDDGGYTASDTYIDAWVEDSSGHELHRAYVELRADPLYKTAVRLHGDEIGLGGNSVWYQSPYNGYPLDLGKPVVRSASKSMTITSTNTWIDGPSVYLDQGQWLVVGVACFNSGSSSGNRKLRAQLRLDTSVYVEGTEVRVATNEYGRIQATAVMTVNSSEGLDATLVLSSSMTFTSATTSYVTAVQLA